MRQLKILLEKEFAQIFRNTTILRMMFIMPSIQLLIIPLAADYEIKNVTVSVIDHDHSMYSRSLINKIEQTPYFVLIHQSASYKEALAQVKKDEVDLVLQVPSGFEQKLIRDDRATLFLAVHAVNGSKAGLGSAYIQQVIADFNHTIRTTLVQFPRLSPRPTIKVSSLFWYNPLMNYQTFMVPGILAVLVTMAGSFLSALNIVHEKETGTIEQINVTPIKKYQFILGKLIPFWVMGLTILTLGLIIAYAVYGIVIKGGLLTLYAFASVYLLGICGLGLLISTLSDNQHQAMLLSFFLMMIFILLGGLYTPIDSMPMWGQWVARFNPVTYFIEVIRMVVLKGSRLADLSTHFLAAILFGAVFNLLAVWLYKKRS